MARKNHCSYTERAELVLKLLEKKGGRFKFRELRRMTHLSTQHLEEALADIRKIRPNLVYAKFDRTFYLADTPTWYSLSTDLSKEMASEGMFGLISDTHLGSVAERLDLVNEAYDEFVRVGVKQVFHSGDMTDGFDEYRGHVNFVRVYGDQPQALHVIKFYPQREGITTYMIQGNHDDSFARRSVDRLSMVVHGVQHEGKDYEGRKDIVYLGQYSHTVILPQQTTMHLIHPRGLVPYAISYKQQKRSEAMDRNLRPDIQVSGHYHMFNFCWLNHTFFIAMPGLQDETEYFKRLGLPRCLGFVICEYKIRDAKLVFLAPRLYMF